MDRYTFRGKRLDKAGKILAITIGMALLLGALSGCSQADRVNSNISKEADAFNVTRRLTVVNARTDKPLFELVGTFSVSNNSAGELVVTSKIGDGQYKKDYVYINKEWTMYVVEDLSGANVSPYHYEINFLPEMIWPFGVTHTDAEDTPAAEYQTRLNIE